MFGNLHTKWRNRDVGRHVKQWLQNILTWRPTSGSHQTLNVSAVNFDTEISSFFAVYSYSCLGPPDL